MPDLSGLPSSLRRHARWLSLAGVPAVVVHPDWTVTTPEVPPRPWLLWMHGRTVNKELDPGRYARLARAGIASVAIDLPGHGERLDVSRHALDATLGVIAEAVEEIDRIVDACHDLGGLSSDRYALGGMSAGGMVTLARLTRPHRFSAAVVECTTGSWRWQPNLLTGDASVFTALNPIDHLENWRPIPLLALHNRFDEWVPIDGQREFLDALAARSSHPELLDLHVYDRTGAPNEHAGFGTMGADAKDRVVSFLSRTLAPA